MVKILKGTAIIQKISILRLKAKAQIPGTKGSVKHATILSFEGRLGMPRLVD
jgi:hypothetical protein